MLRFIELAGNFSYFAFRCLPASAFSIRRPGELFVQLYTILLGSLPLAIVTGLAMGVVVWIHLHGAISAEYVHKVPEYLALAVVVEFAPLGAGLILAGRTGASLSADLGSMKLTEQLDALEVMGQSPMRKLVGPRIMACILSLPILTIFIAFISIGSSYLAEMMGGSLSWTQYKMDCLRSMTLQRMIPSTLKTMVFGFLVGVTGCYYGMTAHGGTEGVGKAATQGVVVSIFVVMVSNVVLVKVIQMIFG